jgi:putative transcriptional regulator
MTTKAFDKIAAGLTDAIGYAKGDATRGRVATIDVKGVRARTGKTQGAFAATYHLPLGTVRDWEQQRRYPDAPARVLLAMIEADPSGVEQLLAKVGPISFEQDSPGHSGKSALKDALKHTTARMAEGPSPTEEFHDLVTGVQVGRAKSA